MPKEIERKFLVKGEQWRHGAVGMVFRQGYLANTLQQTVRVRVAGAKGYLTIKGSTIGISRMEFEYEIPLTDAEELLETLCLPSQIEKTRYRIWINDLLWEVDEFGGDNAGLIVAEVELPREDYVLDLPEWVGEEVSHDPRYFNASLVNHPYKTWSEQDAQQ